MCMLFYVLFYRKIKIFSWYNRNDRNSNISCAAINFKENWIMRNCLRIFFNLRSFHITQSISAFRARFYPSVIQLLQLEIRITFTKANKHRDFIFQHVRICIRDCLLPYNSAGIPANRIFVRSFSVQRTVMLPLLYTTSLQMHFADTRFVPV